MQGADFKHHPAVATALLKPKLGWNLCLQFPDTLDLLAERDMRRYRLQRRIIGPVYHTNNVRHYESLVNAVLDRVIAQLRSLDAAEVDLKEWMHITVVECLSAVSLSWSPGYLRDKNDGASGKHAYMGWRRKSVFGLFPLAVVLESLSKSFGRAFAVLWRVTYHTPKDGFKPFFPVSGRVFPCMLPGLADSRHRPCRRRSRSVSRWPCAASPRRMSVRISSPT